MTNPFAHIPRTDRPAIYHGHPSEDAVYTADDIERRLLDHGAQCEVENCPMLRHLRTLQSPPAPKKPQHPSHLHLVRPHTNHPTP